MVKDYCWISSRLNIIHPWSYLFVSNSHLSNNAGDNTLYAFGYNLEKIKKMLRFDFDLVSIWLEENYMVLNAHKCHVMCLGKDKENETFICNFIFNNSSEEKILGISIDNKSIFKILCKKVDKKKEVLSKLLNHLNDSQKRLVFNSIIKPQLSRDCQQITSVMLNEFGPFRNPPLLLFLMDNIKLGGIPSKIKWKIHACFREYFTFWRYFL